MKIATTFGVLFGTYFKLSEAQVLQPNNTCKVMTFIPFSDLTPPPPLHANDGTANYYGYGYWPDNKTLAKAAFSLMAAAELARHHFNDRNTSIVPELGDLGQCNIKMPDPKFYEILYINSGYTKVYAQRQFGDTQYILHQFRGGNRPNNGGGEVNASSFINGRPSQNSKGLPTNDHDFCAIVGPVLPYEVSGVYNFAEAGRIPMISYETISSKFSSQKEYMSFARVLPEVDDFGSIVAHAMRDIWHREAVGILYDNEDFGEELERPLQALKDLYGYETVRAPFTKFQEQDIKDALLDIRSKGIRTIMVLCDRAPAIDVIARVADDVMMLGSGYFWLLMGAAFRPSLLRALKHKVDSPTNKLLRGAALFTNYDRPTYFPEDPFLQHWKTQKLLSIESLNRLQPLTDEDQPFYIAEDSYFEDEVPSEYASYVYDAIILAGISACRSFNACHTVQDDSFRHIQELVKTEFQGASGKVRFKPNKYVETIPMAPICNSGNSTPVTKGKPISFERLNGRDPKDITFGIYNIRPGSVDSGNNQGYEQVLTHLYNYENMSTNPIASQEENGAWVSVVNTSFVYFDGTTNEPMPRRDAVKSNYHSRGIQITGFILAGIAFAFAIVSGWWVYVNRKHKLVKASQPEFLYILCVGAGLVAPSSIFFAFDESNGLTEQQLSGLCSTFPWLFVVGYLLMYCALFSKLWRLSMLLQMRRKAVHFRQVLLPCVVLMTCSLVVLTVWQVVDPLSWNRKGISAVGEPYETYGECISKKHGVLPFLIPLMLLIGSAVISTAVFSWRLRNVQSELAESQWIFAGIFLQIQTWLVGIPVLLVTHAVSIDAVYFMIVVLTFTFSTSLVGLVIGPKIVAVVREKYFGEAKAKTKISIMGGSTHVSGLTIPTAGNSTGEVGFSFPSTSRCSSASDDGAPKRSDASLESGEIEQLKIQNLELATEAEALNMQILELEQVANQNELLVHRSNELEARVAELELLLKQKEGAELIHSEDDSKLSI